MVGDDMDRIGAEALRKRIQACLRASPRMGEPRFGAAGTIADSRRRRWLSLGTSSTEAVRGRFGLAGMREGAKESVRIGKLERDRKGTEIELSISAPPA